MPLTTRKVFNTLLDPQGNPLANVRVVARLNYASYYKPDWQQEIFPQVVETTTNSDGYWELNLVPNSLLIPDDSYYVIKEGDLLHYVWLPLGDGSPVPLSAVEIGRCLTFGGISGVTGIGVEGHPLLRRNIVLRAGKAIRLDQDNDDRRITITNTGVTGIGADNAPLLNDDVRLKSSDAIIVQQNDVDKSFRFHLSQALPPPSIANQSQAGESPKAAREDHTHEGVHSIEGFVGDVTIEATQGLRKSVANNIITLKSKFVTYLSPLDFKGYGVTTDYFHYKTNTLLSYTALQGGNNITNILTDNNTATYVALNSTNSPIVLQFSSPNAVHTVRIYVGTIRTAGEINITVKDYGNNTIAFASLSPVANAWNEVAVRSLWNAKTIEIAAIGFETIIDCDIAEVRLLMNNVTPAHYIGVRWAGPAAGYSEGLISAMVYLHAGWSYEHMTLWGVTDDPPTAKVEGRIIAPDGTVTVFYPRTGFSGASEEYKVISGPLITPTVSGFYNIVWFMTSESDGSVAGGDPHFCGMQILLV